MAKSRKTKLLKKEKYIKLAQSKALKLLKKNKTFKLTSFVIVEKFSKKDFISFSASQFRYASLVEFQLINNI